MYESKKEFSKEFKLKAIEMSNKSDSIKDVAISLGIREALLYRWRKEFYQKEGEVFSVQELYQQYKMLKKKNCVDYAKRTVI